MGRISKKRQTELKLQFLELLEQRHGIITTCLRELKISKTMYYRWMDEDPKFKEDVNDVVQLCIEFVESMLYKNIEKGDRTSIIFYLKSKGGWVETQRIEQNTTFNEPLRLTIHPPEPKQIDGNDKKLLN